MKHRPSFPIMILIGVLALLLAGQGGVQGYVWCLGEDGHAALEFVGGKACEPSGAYQGSACADQAFNFPAPEEHCGPCSDLSVPSDTASRRPQLQQKDLAVPAGWVAAPVSPQPSPGGVLITNLYPNPPPRISQALLSHRSVVLLI